MIVRYVKPAFDLTDTGNEHESQDWSKGGSGWSFGQSRWLQ